MGESGLRGEVIWSGGNDGRALVSRDVLPDLPVIAPEPVPVSESELGESELDWPAEGCIWMAVVPVAVSQTRLPHAAVVDWRRVKPRSKRGRRYGGPRKGLACAHSLLTKLRPRREQPIDGE